MTAATVPPRHDHLTDSPTGRVEGERGIQGDLSPASPQKGAMRVIVTGCRDWKDDVVVYDELARLLGICYPLAVVVGDCKTGADAAARRWARKRLVGRDPEIFRANWDQHGKAAGPLRNTEMVNSGADLCLAFWDGKSKGTHDTIAKAVRAGIPVRIIPAVVSAPQRGT